MAIRDDDAVVTTEMLREELAEAKSDHDAYSGLADARLKIIQSLEAQLQEREEQIEKIEEHHAEASRAWEARAQTAERKVTALTNEVNQLRGNVRDLELTAERMRGYLDGLEDAKPLAMVPEQRERRLSVKGYNRTFENLTNTLHGGQTKAWYERD